MKKVFFVLLIALSVIGMVYAAGSSDTSSNETSKEALVWIWYPNESTPEFSETRSEFIRVVSEALGRPIKEQLSTDYAITLEALINDNAAFSWLGGEGYTQSHDRNPAILPLVTNSGSSGTLSDAKYYSMLGTLSENADQYKVGGSYNLDTLKGKRFSFVSNSSTSGFRVPSSIISANFNVDSEELLEGGPDMVFSEVMFGGSHQGSFFNVLTGKADVGAFCNSCVKDYMEFISGDFDDPRAGDVLRVIANADAPFDQVPGVEVTLVAAVPVLNAPIVMNTNLLNDEEIQILKDLLTSDEVTNNPLLFGEKGSDVKTLFRAGQRMVLVDDEWYDPIRELNGLK
ncbi:MAG: PhnD/SsuA/transferrin family substrate-binding protein [Spirochaetaceae bacterium]|nr:PhnD/SsuA/transferrin family substrate-binding protein [Spirochaetaceae bacterium]